MVVTPQQWKLVISFIQSVGVPTAFLAAIFYWLAFILAPPLIQGHTNFLNSSIEIQARIANSVEEIVEIEQDSQDFMAQVEKTHAEHTILLGTIEAKVK